MVTKCDGTSPLDGELHCIRNIKQERSFIAIMSIKNKTYNIL